MRPRSEAANQSPTSEATIGPAAAVTAPRKRRAMSRCPNDGAVALQIIAAPQSTIAPPSTRVLVTRSASTPKGRLAAAATSDVTVTSNPTSVLLIPRSCLSWIAEAPTVAVSALASARTDARRRITRVRSLPPSAVVSAREPARPSRPAAAAATPTGRRPELASRAIIHSAGPAEGGWYIYDIWESREAFQRFMDEKLGPASGQVFGDGPPPPGSEPQS